MSTWKKSRLPGPKGEPWGRTRKGTRTRPAETAAALEEPRCPRQAQRGEVEGPGASGEERLEGDGVQALLRRGEEGVGIRVGSRAGDAAAEPSPSDLGGLGPGEVDADGEASGEDEGAARGVVAQGHQLEGEGLVLALEALAGESGLHAREGAAGEAELGFPSARTHGAVGSDDGLRVADGGGDEAGEEAVLARLDGADAGLAADDAVEDGRASRGSAGASGSESESKPGRRARTRPVASRAVRKPSVSSSTRTEREERERTRKDVAAGSPWVSQV